MNKLLFYSIISIFLLGCASGNKVATSDHFHEVSVGMSVKELKAKMGKPYSVKNLGDGYVEYKYIERLMAANRVLEERYYLFIVKNGRVTSKKQVDMNRPVYERNSYEMQTSSNEDEEDS